MPVQLHLYLLINRYTMATELGLPETFPPQRPMTAYSSLSELSKPFLIDPKHRSYKHQYANVYFVRLVELRPIVEERAGERWKSVRGKLTWFMCTLELTDRSTASTPPNPQPSTVAAVSYRRDGIPRHANEAERPRGYGERCKLNCTLHGRQQLTLIALASASSSSAKVLLGPRRRSP
jgi:hypothetical protein